MSLSFKDAAYRVLAEAGEPLHYREIARRILEGGLSRSEAKSPATSLNAVLAVEIKRNGAKSPFVRVAPGVFGLRSNVAQTQSADGEPEDADLRVRIPLFPRYSELRALLPVLDGRPRAEVTGLRSTIAALRGTPQDPVDWTSPDAWIPERLAGSDRDLAEAIWRETEGRVNPRHIYGHWLLAIRYGLLAEDDAGILHLTDRGRDFVRSPGGEVEAAIDEAEGLLKLLAIVADHGSAPFGELVPDWAEYLARRSKFGSDSTIKDTLRRRLRNLLERGLVARTGFEYRLTDEGMAYLEHAGDEDAVTDDVQQQIRTLTRKQHASVRESIEELLAEMDPIAFEHLIGRLLEEMGYDDVEVTARSGDGGVDVVANIELGITSVREVVQAKRHKRTIQRKDLDALRGSLHRFGAVRGTIITTSKFSKGTREAAFEPGAAPITLIDGDKLVDLLIEHGIGARKRSVELLELDPAAFAGSDTGDGAAEEDDGARG